MPIDKTQYEDLIRINLLLKKSYEKTLQHQPARNATMDLKKQRSADDICNFMIQIFDTRIKIIEALKANQTVEAQRRVKNLERLIIELNVRLSDFPNESLKNVRTQRDDCQQYIDEVASQYMGNVIGASTSESRAALLKELDEFTNIAEKTSQITLGDVKAALNKFTDLTRLMLDKKSNVSVDDYRTATAELKKIEKLINDYTRNSPQFISKLSQIRKELQDRLEDVRKKYDPKDEKTIPTSITTKSLVENVPPKGKQEHQGINPSRK